MSLRTTLVAIALFVGSTALSARATVAEAWTLEELVAASDLIVVAHARDTTASVHRSVIVTDTTWIVDESLRGNRPIGALVRTRSLGGRIGNVALRVQGEPVVTIGERAIVLGVAQSDGSFRSVAMDQGVLRIESNGGRDLVVPSTQGPNLVRRDLRSGRLVAASGALPDRTPLDEVLARIRSLVGTGGAPR